jgi:hypothetical protein
MAFNIYENKKGLQKLQPSLKINVFLTQETG